MIMSHLGMKLTRRRILSLVNQHPCFISYQFLIKEDRDNSQAPISPYPTTANPMAAQRTERNQGKIQTTIL
jgi:hypothetical protein